MKLLPAITDDSITQFALSGLLLAALVAAADYTNTSAMIGPFSATCALLALLPKAPFSQPGTVAWSHAICIGTGALMAMLQIPPLIAAFAAAWLSIFLMAGYRVVHAPAVAHAVILALGKQDVPVYLLAAGLCSAGFALFAYVSLWKRNSLRPAG